MNEQTNDKRKRKATTTIINHHLQPTNQRHSKLYLENISTMIRVASYYRFTLIIYNMKSMIALVQWMVSTYFPLRVSRLPFFCHSLMSFFLIFVFVSPNTIVRWKHSNETISHQMREMWKGVNSFEWVVFVQSANTVSLCFEWNLCKIVLKNVFSLILLQIFTRILQVSV